MTEQFNSTTDQKTEDLENLNAETEINSNKKDETTTEDKIAELEQQLAKANDDALRSAAEVQNLRRRCEQDVEKAHKFALERFAHDLLAVVDSLERGLELTADSANNSDTKSVREGLELTLKLLLDTLNRYQIVAVNPINQPFNPELHQAMSMREDTKLEPNTVIEVFQKGYTLNERLLRPAMVVVSKAPTTEIIENLDGNN